MKHDAGMKLEALVAKLRGSALFALLMVAMGYFILSRVPLIFDSGDSGLISSLQMTWVTFIWLILLQIYIDTPPSESQDLPDISAIFGVVAFMVGLAAIVLTIVYFRQPLSAFLGFHIGAITVKQLLQGLLIALVVSWAAYRDFFAKRKCAPLGATSETADHSL